MILLRWNVGDVFGGYPFDAARLSLRASSGDFHYQHIRFCGGQLDITTVYDAEFQTKKGVWS